MRTYVLILIAFSFFCGTVSAPAQPAKNPDEILLEELMQVKHDVRTTCEADNGTLDRFDFKSLSHSSFPAGKVFIVTSACCMPGSMHSCFMEIRLVLYDYARTYVVDVQAQYQNMSELRTSNGKLTIVQRSDSIVNKKAITTCEYTEVIWDDFNKQLVSVNVWQVIHDSFNHAQSCP